MNSMNIHNRDGQLVSTTVFKMFRYQVGTIGLCASQKCRKVIGIELVPEADLGGQQPVLAHGILDEFACLVTHPPKKT
jgi:hypothetical protein